MSKAPLGKASELPELGEKFRLGLAEWGYGWRWLWVHGVHFRIGLGFMHVYACLCMFMLYSSRTYFGLAECVFKAVL